jgi:hypothetical protein
MALTFNEIVQDYRWRYVGKTEEELAWFRGQPTVADAIRKAAFALKPNGARYSHQRWLKDETARMAAEIMLAHEAEIAAAPDFESLHELLGRLLAQVPGAGEMYLYDTAFRLSGKFGRPPTRVFLHRGTRDGARAIGFDSGRAHIEMTELPEPLQVLKAYEVEDVLCLYKNDLAGSNSKTKRSGCAPVRRRGRC